MKMMTERDRQVTEDVACPVCKSAPGETCFYVNRWKQRQLMTHPHRLRVTAFAYKQVREGEL